MPHGTFKPGDKPGPAAGAGGLQGSARAWLSAVNDPLQTFTATDLGDSGWTGSVQDPSEASAGSVVLLSVNRQLAYSTDGGQHFVYKDPTTIFPTADGNVCCDQVLHYDRRTNRFFYLLQYGCSSDCTAAGATVENRYRLAVASPQQVASSGATAWKYWDFTSRTFNEPQQWMDFPDMAIGRNNLYLTFDLPRKGAAIWAQIPINGLVNSNSIGFRYYDKTGDYVLKTVQNTDTRGWIARRKADNKFELTSWDDGDVYVYHHTVTFPTPPTTNCSVSTDDAVDMFAHFNCAGFSSRIAGAARRANGDIWLAWTAGKRINGQSTDLYPQSHIELLTIDPSGATVTRRRSIWNANYAWGYPGLSASPGGEVAMSFGVGGGTLHYWNWGVGMVTNRESFLLVGSGSMDRTRMGDYLTVRPGWPSTKRFSATGYVLDSANKFHPWWALFGRSGDRPKTLPPFRLLRADLVFTAKSGNGVYEVQNTGAIAAGPFVVRIDEGNGRTLDQPVQGLNPGDSARGDYPCPPANERLIADATNQVPESNERNNTFYPAPCPPSTRPQR